MHEFRRVSYRTGFYRISPDLSLKLGRLYFVLGDRHGEFEVCSPFAITAFFDTNVHQPDPTEGSYSFGFDPTFTCYPIRSRELPKKWIDGVQALINDSYPCASYKEWDYYWSHRAELSENYWPSLAPDTCAEHEKAKAEMIHDLNQAIALFPAFWDQAYRAYASSAFHLHEL